MSKQIYINLPVKDLAKSTEFYSALGFQINPEISNEDASGMTWSENISIMLLTREFYSKFINKTIADTQKTSSCLICLSMDSKEEVQRFADTAKANGGDYYIAEINQGLDFMFGYEVTDPDGHILEPLFMDITKFPAQE
jgi:uncharacterized protein